MTQLNLTFEKPQIKNRDEQLKKVYIALRNFSHSFITKPELCAKLGMDWNSNNERRIRDLVSELSHEYPIISVSSNNKGYLLARHSEDAELAKQTVLELRSRIEEIEKRIKPLEKFLEGNK